MRLGLGRINIFSRREFSLRSTRMCWKLSSLDHLDWREIFALRFARISFRSKWSERKMNLHQTAEDSGRSRWKFSLRRIVCSSSRNSSHSLPRIALGFRVVMLDDYTLSSSVSSMLPYLMTPKAILPRSFDNRNQWSSGIQSRDSKWLTLKSCFLERPWAATCRV